MSVRAAHAPAILDKIVQAAVATTLCVCIYN